MERVSVMCFLASYALAWLLELLRIRGRSAIQRLATLGVTAAGFLAHTFYLYYRAQATHLPPLLSSMQDWLYVLAWLVVLIYLFVSLSDQQVATGVLVLPLVMALILASWFVLSPVSGAGNVQQSWAMLHVVLLVFGMAGLLVGLLVSVMYLWQHWRLKSRLPAAQSFPFPSLERLHRWNRWLVITSVPLLTLGMALGVGLVWMRVGADVGERVWTDPLVVASLGVWLVMAVSYVWMLVAVRTPGRQMASLTAFSGALLLATVLGAQALTRLGGAHTLHGPAHPAEGHP